MPVWFRSYGKFLIAICLIIGFCLIEGESQTRRKKRARRVTRPAVAKPVITNPPIAPPEETATTGGDVKIISTADSTESAQPSQGKKAKTETADPSEKEDIKQTINALSNQVNKLNDKLTQMNEDDRYQLDMERLTRAEQRAEQLRSQLIDIQSKIADFEAKLELIDYALKPENLENSMAGYGSTRPEAARDARKKQLEGERARVCAQLKLAETSKSRLEVASANADAEVDHLRAKLNQRREQMDAMPVEAPKPRKPE
jgi:chromosome segregation ATPase